MSLCETCGVKIKKGGRFCKEHKYDGYKENMRQYQKINYVKPKGPKEEKIQRRCLRCNRKFMAEGKFNRVCPGCAEINKKTLDPEVYGAVIQ